MIKRQKINSKEEYMQSTATLGREYIPCISLRQLLGKYEDAYLNYEQNSLKIAKIEWP